jgi:chitinase
LDLQCLFTTRSNLTPHQGQGNDNQQNLASYCQSDSGVDIILLAFIDHFGAGAYPGGQIGACTINSDKSFSEECADVAKDIQTCKDNGVKIFLSIGGAGADNQWHLNGEGDAAGVAYSFWNSYANPAYVDKGTPRPFGNVFLDGWDIDLESRGASDSPDSWRYLGSMINHLRGYFSRDPNHQYFIGGAPQCPIPEKNMGLSIRQAQYDYLWIQFYNNDCSASTLFDGSGGSAYNLKDWPGHISDGASKNAKLLVGLPGSNAEAQGYYIPSNKLASLVDQSKNVPGFDGIMVYDAGDVSSHGTNTPGKNYIQVVKQVLNNA